MFGRILRTRFSTLLPCVTLPNVKNISTDKLLKKVEKAQSNQVKNSKSNKSINYNVNEIVLVKSYKYVNAPTFVKGKITKKMGTRTYLVEVPELQKTWKRHANQIKKHTLHESCSIPTQISGNSTSLEHPKVPNDQGILVTNELAGIDNVNNVNDVNNVNPVAISNRLRREAKPIDRLNYS